MTDNPQGSDVKPVNTLLILIGLPAYTMIVFGLLLFLPAGTVEWIEAWIWIAIFTFITTTFTLVINRRDPTVIRNRAKIKKTGVTDEIKTEAGSDKWLYPILGLCFFATLLIPGFNIRYEWTSMPLEIEIIGFVLATTGVVLLNGATLQNAYASKLLDINEGQKLIDTGLYAHIRHPLYAGASILMLGAPLALGSWYAILPAVLTIIAFLVRIQFEEAMLIKGMDSYEDYRKRVKYKLIPGLY